MLITDTKSLVNLPEKSTQTGATQKIEKGDSAIDFDKMLTESNVVRQGEFEKEKNSIGTGEFHVGETKNDKEFREQLEKITGKKQQKAKSKLDQDDYLNLLVTQLKYQDPGKPMEHYEMASQMAQFNAVEQLVGVNKSLNNLNKAQVEAKTDKLTQYIDKYVEVQGNNLKLNSNGATSISRFELPAKASVVTLEIKDSQSKLIKTMALGEMQAGTHEVDWDGKDSQGQKAAAGEYTFSINASSDDGKPITAKTSYLAQVKGVTDILKGGKLETTVGTLEPEKILSIRNYQTNHLNSQIQNPTETKNLMGNKGDKNGVN